MPSNKQKAIHLPDGKLSGQVIIDQLIRNMEMGQFEMAYSILLPCVYSLYLHPEDYTRLAGILELIKEDARRALSSRMAQLNARPLGLSLTRSNKDRREYKIACKDWALEFFRDSEGSVPAGDVEIHSELSETPQPGYHGVKTTLLDREPSVPDAAGRPQSGDGGFETRKASERVHAEIRYEDDSGSQLFLMTQNEISIGRGGNDLQVQLTLYTNDEVSREHARISRDVSTGRFSITDQSRNGTWVNGRRLARGVQEPIPDRAEILVAEVITLLFDAKK